MPAHAPHLTASALDEPGVRHGFFTREGGVSEGIYASLNCGNGSRDEPAHVAENRGRVSQAMGVAPDQLFTMYQVHSSNVAVVERARSGAPVRVDGVASATPGLALGVLVADCAPVLFLDAQARVIGAAHAGWRGATSGVLEATVEAMERIGATRGQIRAAIGPTISQGNYEVGADFVGTVRAADRRADAFLAPGTREGHMQFDLPGYIVARLEAAGLGAVEDLRACTYADEDRFFSYRRATHRGEPDYGRQIAAIALEVE